jgi:hypothetical protein
MIICVLFYFPASFKWVSRPFKIMGFVDFCQLISAYFPSLTTPAPTPSNLTPLMGYGNCHRRERVGWKVFDGQERRVWDSDGQGFLMFGEIND